MDIPIGAQYPRGDEKFRARMQLHQSWYRAAVLQVECGIAPSGHDLYGHFLTHEDGDRGLNFLTPEIAALARENGDRDPKGVEPVRLHHNMLSSQPMLFNLFGPIALDREIAAPMLEAVLDTEVSEVTKVLFEHAPQPSARYLGDATSFDVYMEFGLEDGRSGFFGIEGKLTERFSNAYYPYGRYRRWVEAVDSPWIPEARNRLDAVEHNQLWRDHMLAISLLSREPARYDLGKFMLVRHQSDEETVDVVAGYRDCLRADDDTFIDAPLDWLLAQWEPIVRGTGWGEWYSMMVRRYSNVSESESVWEER